MLSPNSILGLVKPADATQSKAKHLESKLAVRRQWENEDPRQHDGIILDSVVITAAAYNAREMLSAVMLQLWEVPSTTAERFARATTS